MAENKKSLDEIMAGRGIKPLGNTAVLEGEPEGKKSLDDIMASRGIKPLAIPEEQQESKSQKSFLPSSIGEAVMDAVLGPLLGPVFRRPDVAVDAISDVGAMGGAVIGAGAGMGIGSAATGALGAVAGAGLGSELENIVRNFMNLPPEEQMIKLANDPVLNDILNTAGFDILGGGAIKGATKVGKGIASGVASQSAKNFPELTKTFQEGRAKLTDILGIDDLSKLEDPSGSARRGKEVIGELQATKASREGKIAATDEEIRVAKEGIGQQRKLIDESSTRAKEDIKAFEGNVRRADQEISRLENAVETQTKYPLRELNSRIKELEKIANTRPTAKNKVEWPEVNAAKQELQGLYAEKESVLASKVEDFNRIRSFKSEQENLIKQSKETLQQNQKQVDSLLDEELAIATRKPQFDDFEEAIDKDFLNKIVSEKATPIARKVIGSIIQEPETIELALRATKGKIKPQLQEELYSNLIKDENPLQFLEGNKANFDLLLPTERAAEGYKNLVDFYKAVSKTPEGPKKATGISLHGRTINMTLGRGIADSLAFGAGYTAGSAVGGFGLGMAGGTALSMSMDRFIKLLGSKKEFAELVIPLAEGADNISKAQWRKFFLAAAGTKVTIQSADGKKKTGVINATPTLVGSEF